MEASRAIEILNQFAGKRVIVIGDVMVDEYVFGVASRISPEAPVIVIEAERQSQVPGGAANVVNNLCALGSVGVMFGVVGDDEPGRQLARSLVDLGADTTGLLVELGRPTTRKTRFFAHSQQVVRVDHELRAPISHDTETLMLGLLVDLIPKADAVLVSDYQKGVLSSGILEGAITISRQFNKPISGNLKPSSFAGKCQATVITMNIHEAGIAMNGRVLVTDDDIREAGFSILERTQADHILITLGSKGLSLFSAGSTTPFHVAPLLVEVYDTAGAGDTVISTMTLALAAGATAQESAALANEAAAQVVRKVGVATVTVAEISSSILERKRQ